MSDYIGWIIGNKVNEPLLRDIGVEVLFCEDEQPPDPCIVWHVKIKRECFHKLFDLRDKFNWSFDETDLGCDR